LAKQKVLVVDDEETIRFVFSELLEQEGLDVATAADGEGSFPPGSGTRSWSPTPAGR
jgi:CheY-like chemotaxis protein